jgi:ketosteroid isomerase-like protein
MTMNRLDQPAPTPADDLWAIEQVVYRYAHGIDARDLEMVLSCFTDDAEVDYDGRIQRRGAAELRELFGGPTERRRASSGMVGLDTVERTTHHMTNVLIELDGEHAAVQTTALAFLAGRRDGSEVVVQRGLRYVDQFVRRDGNWAIEHRVHSMVWSSAVPAQ